MNIKPQPENAGFDVRGDLKVRVQWFDRWPNDLTDDQGFCFILHWTSLTKNCPLSLIDNRKLFDLGFCKELTKKLYDEESGMYKLTQLTGSPPYMVSCAYVIHWIENVTLNTWHLLFNLLSGPWKFSWQAIRKTSRCIFIWCARMGNASLQACGKNTLQWKYGDWSHSARRSTKGIYVQSQSFIIHVKLILSSQFYGYKFLEYKERVVEGNYRPPINELLTSRVQELIKECWAPDPKKRPPFERICLSLRAAYEEAAKEQGCVDPGGVSRSVRLVNKSVRSFRMHVKRRSSNEMAAFEE